MYRRVCRDTLIFYIGDSYENGTDSTDTGGKRPGVGVYYAKPNETPIIAPVRHLIGYNAGTRRGSSGCRKRQNTRIPNLRNLPPFMAQSADRHYLLTR
jgi:hypothetical protein